MSAEMTWRKSSYSGPDTNCVEVGLSSDEVGVRDTKDCDGGLLAVEQRQWRAFLAAVRSGRFDG
ncbi:DUF397 domain-containing protein [Saccharopolyspora sp. NPDC002376]